MSLNKLDELKNDIPEVDNILNNKIFEKYNKSNKKPNILYLHKKLILSLSALIIIVSGVVALILANSIETKPNYEKPTLLYAAKDLEKYPLDAEGLDIFIDKTQEFGYVLTESYYNEYNDYSKNIAISPISIYMGLAMLAECSNDSAKEEILNALGITYEEMITHTESLYEYINRNNNDKYNRTILNNSIWFNHTLDLNNDTLYNLSNKYYCTSYDVDFLKKNKDANNAIRDYIKQSTNGLIDQDFKLSQETLFTLINTLYLKTVWDLEELEMSEKNYTFYNADGTTTSIKFVEDTYVVGKAYETEEYKHFYIRSDGGYVFKFIMPKDGYILEDIFIKENLNVINNIDEYNGVDYINNIKYETRVIFPEFTASSDNSINNILKEDFNINEVFDINSNPLNVMDDNVACGDIKHIAKLNVNRRGIEGAAVTLVPGPTAAPPMTIVKNDIVLDRAFGYVITDHKDNILFSGVVNKI